MPYRHRPFGISEQALRRELLRRRRAHRTAIAVLRTELARVTRHNAELNQFTKLLGAEILALEEAERNLSRELSAPALPDEESPSDSTLHSLRQYRALHDHLILSVLSLIAPFLSPGPGGRSTMDQREERTWPRNQSQSGSGSAAP